MGEVNIHEAERHGRRQDQLHHRDRVREMTEWVTNTSIVFRRCSFRILTGVGAPTRGKESFACTHALLGATRKPLKVNFRALPLKHCHCNPR